VAEALGHTGASALGDFPNPSEAENFGVIVDAELGGLVAGGRHDVNLVDSVAASQIPDEAPDAGVSFARCIWKQDRQV
jgi:hypothetical protein